MLTMPTNRPGFIIEGWLHQAKYMRKVAAKAAASKSGKASGFTEAKALAQAELCEQRARDAAKAVFA